MGVIMEGDVMYKVGPDGKKEYVPPTDFSINGRKIFNYNQENGALSLDMDEGDIEKMIKGLGNIPEEGINVTLPLPPFGQNQYFKGIKKIEKLVQEGKPYMKFGEAAKPEKTRENLLERIKKYIGMGGAGGGGGGG